MHDRRIDGETHIFGNAGGLFMNAMTWYDHTTRSIWSQPWGRAIEGPLGGIELFLLPSQLTTWSNWRTEHPQTLLMTNDLDRLGSRRQLFDPNFVIGLLIDGHARAYYYEDVAEITIVNDFLDQYPVLIWAADDNFHAYLRQVGEEALTFHVTGDNLVDDQTGSTWDISRGLAMDGPLQGQSMQPVPSSTAYDWAWLDFFPQTTFFDP